MNDVLSELNPEERQIFLKALTSLAAILEHDPDELMAVSGID